MLLLLVGLAFEEGEEGKTIDLFRGGLADEVGHGGEDVPEGAEVISGAVWLDEGGPASQHGSADPGFVHVTLHAAEACGGVPEIGIVPTFAMCPVVGGKDDEGIVIEAIVLKEGEDVADLVIEILDHGRESSDGIDDVGRLFCWMTTDSVLPNDLVEFGEDLTPLFVEFLGCVHGRVGNGGGDVAEKGRLGFGVGLNELEGVVHNDVMDIFPLLKWDLFAVVNVTCWIVGVCNRLAFPTTEFIESVA